MFVHCVYFWGKAGLTEAERAAFLQGLESLLAIETVRHGWIGPPAAPASRPVIDASYTFALVTVFADQEGHDIYQEHPVHKAFIRDCQGFWQTVKVYDSLSA